MNRLLNTLMLLGIGAAVVASFAYLSIDLGALADNANLAKWALMRNASSAPT